MRVKAECDANQLITLCGFSFIPAGGFIAIDQRHGGLHQDNIRHDISL
jgi:hypothetical protein